MFLPQFRHSTSELARLYLAPMSLCYNLAGVRHQCHDPGWPCRHSASQVKPGTPQTSLPSAAARMLRRNVTHRGQHRLFCSGCFGSRPWLLSSTHCSAGNTGLFGEASSHLPNQNPQNRKGVEMPLPFLRLHWSPEVETQGSKGAMRPCLSSVARRRLKFSTLPSEPWRSGFLLRSSFPDVRPSLDPNLSV